MTERVFDTERFSTALYESNGNANEMSAGAGRGQANGRTDLRRTVLVSRRRQLLTTSLPRAKARSQLHRTPRCFFQDSERNERNEKARFQTHLAQPHADQVDRLRDLDSFLSDGAFDRTVFESRIGRFLFADLYYPSLITLECVASPSSSIGRPALTGQSGTLLRGVMIKMPDDPVAGGLAEALDGVAGALDGVDDATGGGGGGGRGEEEVAHDLEQCLKPFETGREWQDYHVDGSAHEL